MQPRRRSYQHQEPKVIALAATQQKNDLIMNIGVMGSAIITGLWMLSLGM